MKYDAHVHAGMFKDPLKMLSCAYNSSITPLCVSTTVSECSSLLSLLDGCEYSKTPVFCGIHPWYLREADENSFYLMERLCQSTKISGVGECGLDSACETPLCIQIEALCHQLDIACSNSLPVNLHVRQCHGELLRVLKGYRGKLSGIIHNFTFSYELLKSYLDLGLVPSVGHHILFKSMKMVSVLKRAGIENLLIETDADYLHTGEYDPLVVVQEYGALGEILNLDAMRVELEIEKTFNRILGKSK